jgi:hypothetical protein
MVIGRIVNAATTVARNRLITPTRVIGESLTKLPRRAALLWLVRLSSTQTDT